MLPPSGEESVFRSCNSEMFYSVQSLKSKKPKSRPPEEDKHVKESIERPRGSRGQSTAFGHALCPPGRREVDVSPALSRQVHSSEGPLGPESPFSKGLAERKPILAASPVSRSIKQKLEPLHVRNESGKMVRNSKAGVPPRQRKDTLSTAYGKDTESPFRRGQAKCIVTPSPHYDGGAGFDFKAPDLAMKHSEERLGRDSEVMLSTGHIKRPSNVIPPAVRSSLKMERIGVRKEMYAKSSAMHR